MAFVSPETCRVCDAESQSRDSDKMIAPGANTLTAMTRMYNARRRHPESSASKELMRSPSVAWTAISECSLGGELTGAAQRTSSNRWVIPLKGEPEAVGGDDGEGPGQADEPAGEHVGEPVVPEEDAGESHRHDEERAERDGDGALPGRGRLDEDQVDDDRRQHGGVEGVSAREGRRHLERGHRERGG